MYLLRHYSCWNVFLIVLPDLRLKNALNQTQGLFKFVNDFNFCSVF